MISADGRENSATIHQDADVYCVKLKAGETITHDLTNGRGLWSQLIKGNVDSNGIGLNFFFNFFPEQPNPPEGSPPALFFGAFMPSGNFALVKSLEILGGIFVAIPKNRIFGLFVLGPIIINILAFHVFLIKGAGFADSVTLTVALLISILPRFLLWTARNSFKGLLN